MANLRLLEEVRSSGPEDELLSDTYQRLITDERLMGLPSFSA